MGEQNLYNVLKGEDKVEWLSILLNKRLMCYGSKDDILKVLTVSFMKKLIVVEITNSREIYVKLEDD